MSAPRHDRDDDSCPGCGATTGIVQLTSTPRVQSWECACGTGWACTRVGPSPQHYLDQLTATAELHSAARRTLRQVIAVADQASTLTDPETAGTTHRAGRPGTQAHPVSRFGLFAMSPVDSCVHLLTPEGDQCPDVLTARCGLLLPPVITCHDQPPPGPPCERCRLIFTVGMNVPLNDALAAAGSPDRAADLAQVRASFEAAWVRWNIARAVAFTAAFGCLTWALMIYGRTRAGA
ncbi:MAG: anthrone oxygenase family protein [Pseudonocardiaceae bacterium]